MRKRKSILGIVSCLILTGASLSSQSAGRENRKSEILEQEVELHLSDATLVLALSTLAVEKRIPIGLEFAGQEKNEVKFTIDIGPSKLKDVLNLIVQNRPDYDWKLRDGVINVSPRGARDPFFEKLLNVQIQSFVPKKGLDKFGIRNAILDLPEVQELLKEDAVTASRLGYPYKPSNYSRAVDLKVSDSDLRGVLNKVVRETEHKIWVLHWIGWGKELEIGF